MITTQLTPQLHLNSGIPVVYLEGEWDETIGRSLTELVSRLTRAGHYEIVVNLSGMKYLSFNESRWCETLVHLTSLCTRTVKLEVVATRELIENFLKRKIASRLQWATSEDEAISQLKGLPIFCRSIELDTRLSG